jgi:tungstate transport system ATP-binding protein
MKPLYDLHGIRQEFGNRTVLDLPALTLESQRLYAVTGANGAGKSSLLQILAFLAQPKSGTLTFAGSAVETGSDLVALRRRVTLLSQSPYLLRGSVAENVDYGLRVRGIAAHERQSLVRLALAEVGLTDFSERRARALSGGEQQRVALARALVLKPEVLLLDEPCASLDSGSAARIEMILRQLPRRGTSVIFSTHDPQQGGRLGAINLHLAAGQIVSPPVIPPISLRQEKSLWLSVLTMQEA